MRLVGLAVEAALDAGVSVLVRGLRVCRRLGWLHSPSLSVLGRCPCNGCKRARAEYRPDPATDAEFDRLKFESKIQCNRDFVRARGKPTQRRILRRLP